MSNLTDLEEEAISSLIEVWGAADVVLVGGGALTAHRGMAWRTTQDLDLVVGVDEAAAAAALHGRLGWDKDPHVEPRWIYEWMSSFAS